jgi:2-iminobutanoate/2-iminopropanoate deaminase
MANKQEIRHPDKDVYTGAYSAGVLCDGWLFVSGQGPQNLKTGKVEGESIEEQTLATLQNVEKILLAGGCTRDDVVKSTVHLKDLTEFSRYDKVYSEFFSGVRPARTTVQSGLMGIKVEIDVIARVPTKK